MTKHSLVDTQQYQEIAHLFGGSSKSEKTYNLDQSTVVNSMKKLIQHSAMKVAGKNLQSFSTNITAKNVIEFSNIKCDHLKISGTSQSNDVKLKEATEAKNTIKNTLNDSVSNDISNAILGKKSDAGTSLSDITGQAAGVANNLIDTTGDVLGSAFGGKTSSKETTNVDRSVTANVKEVIKNEMSKEVNEQNIQTAITSLSTDNILKFNDIVCKTGEITDTEQKNVVEALIKKVFNNERTTTMATNIVQELKDKIENVSESEGDIKAAGDALAQNINALGEASKGLGAGIGTALKGAGEGMANATKYLIIGGVCCFCVLILALFGWLIMSDSDVKNVGSAVKNVRRPI